jgi:hypothetical protein
MLVRSICAARSSRMGLIGLLGVVGGALVLSQTGVVGAEPTITGEFSVLGDGKLPGDRPSLGKSRDPLSAPEIGYAISVARSDKSIPASSTNVRGEKYPQFINIELPQDIETAGRKAVVVFYDYTDNRAYRQYVDLEAGRVTRSESSVETQPTATPDEARVATTLAIQHDRHLLFERQFEELQGVPLISAEQVAFRGGTWVANEALSNGKECGEERCIELILSTPTGDFLNTRDFVVNLSRQTVIELVKS